MRIDGAEATDARLCEAFAAVEAVRERRALTYFEFGTLAALWLFARAGLDVLVLEVGLGGRLDAVNIIDADVAIVTTVAIDHVDYLGATREEIGREKAGIFRAGRVAICADRDPPRTLLAHAAAIGARLLRIGIDYDFTAQRRAMELSWPGGARHGLPHPALRGAYQLANAATALAALDALARRAAGWHGRGARRRWSRSSCRADSRCLPGRPVTVLDVAHNPQAAARWPTTSARWAFIRRRCAVFGIMADKDIDGVIAALLPRVDRW